MPAGDRYCEGCILINQCELPCKAYTNLFGIYRAETKKVKQELLKQLRKDLNIVDAEPSKNLEKLGNKIIDKFNDLHFIKNYEIKIGYVLAYQRPPGTKIKYAECRKVLLQYQAYLPYDFVITFYEPNTSMLNENQQKILMYHELRHIGVGEKGLKIELHDIEDFGNILQQYGLDWNSLDKEVPDILEGD